MFSSQLQNNTTGALKTNFVTLKYFYCLLVSICKSQLLANKQLHCSASYARRKWINYVFALAIISRFHTI